MGLRYWMLVNWLIVQPISTYRFKGRNQRHMPEKKVLEKKMKELLKQVPKSKLLLSYFEETGLATASVIIIIIIMNNNNNNNIKRPLTPKSMPPAGDCLSSAV